MPLTDSSPTHRSRRHRDRSRSRSPRHHHRHTHHEEPPHHHRRRSPVPEKKKNVRLPFNSRQLSKRDYDEYEPLFARYLGLQKGLILEELEESEVKGRWKSFVKRWNRGDLAEGWYTLEIKQQSQQTYGEEHPQEGTSGPSQRRGSPDYGRDVREPSTGDSDVDEIGPTLPEHDRATRRRGPAIPNMQDLELRDELLQEDATERLEDFRYERKLERKQQKEQLEDLAPRADPGSFERKLEKRREAGATLRSFREARSPGAAEVGERDLMGGDDDGVDGLKKRKKEETRKKNEREVRKEEILRARAEEREMKMAQHRAKEEKTMEMLRALAQQRFG